MTPTNFKDLIHYKARTTDATFTDSEILLLMNIYKDEIAGRIQRLRPGIWNVPANFDLVAGKREYGFPADVINSINSLDLKLSSTSNYIPAVGLKEQPKELSLENEDDISGWYSGNPHYFIRRKAIYILSETIEDITEGGLLTYNSLPANISDLTSTVDMSVDPTNTEHGFPQEFHELWNRRVVIAYKDKEEIPLTKEEQEYDIDLEMMLEEFSAPADQTMDEVREVPSFSLLYGNGYDL